MNGSVRIPKDQKKILRAQAKERGVRVSYAMAEFVSRGLMLEKARPYLMASKLRKVFR